VVSVRERRPIQPWPALNASAVEFEEDIHDNRPKMECTLGVA
jgi:hypothetical protein